MLPNHHPGVYIRKKRQWSCCENPKIDGTGCTPSDKNNTKTNGTIIIAIVCLLSTYMK